VSIAGVSERAAGVSVARILPSQMMVGGVSAWANPTRQAWSRLTSSPPQSTNTAICRTSATLMLVSSTVS